MRKTLIAGVAALVSLGAGSALADVFVFATIDKTKTVDIIEVIDIHKFVDIYAVVNIDADKAAESDAMVNQRNDNNTGCSNCAEKRDEIFDSGNGNAGVLSVNQATGNMNNQGNAVAAAVDVRIGDGDTPNGGGTGFAGSQAAAEQVNEWNTIWAINLLFRDAVIGDSFNGNTGVVHFNQGAGNMANQANVLSMAVSFAESGVALSEADLGQFNMNNTVLESNESDPQEPGTGVGIHKTASLSNSLNGNTGIVGGNQSSGNMANQANVVSFSAAQLANGI